MQNELLRTGCAALHASACRSFTSSASSSLSYSLARCSKYSVLPLSSWASVVRFLVVFVVHVASLKRMQLSVSALGRYLAR